MNRLGRVLASAAMILALFGPRALAQAPESIFGTYQRQSVTCGGGPGFADRSGPVECRSTFEDRLEITPGASPDTVFVVFGLHFGYSDYCAFRGHGTWSKGKVILDDSEKPLPSSCRLEVNLVKSEATLSDLEDNCDPALCTAPQKLHGVTYRKP